MKPKSLVVYFAGEVDIECPSIDQLAMKSYEDVSSKGEERW